MPSRLVRFCSRWSGTIMARSAPRPPPGGRGARWPPRPGASSLARPDYGPRCGPTRGKGGTLGNENWPAGGDHHRDRHGALCLPLRHGAGSGGLACGRGHRSPACSPSSILRHWAEQAGAPPPPRHDGNASRHKGGTCVPDAHCRHHDAHWPGASQSSLARNDGKQRTLDSHMGYCTIRGAPRRDATRRSAPTLSAGVQEPCAQPKIRVIGRSARSFDWAYFKPSAEWSVAGWSWPSTR